MCTKLKRAFAAFCSCCLIFSVCVPVSSAEALPAVPVEPDGKITFQMGLRGAGQPFLSPNFPSFVIPLVGALNYQTVNATMAANVTLGPYVMTDAINFELEGRFYLALQPYVGTSSSIVGTKSISYNGFKGGRVVPIYKGVNTIYEGDPIALNQLVTLNSKSASGQYYSGGDVVYFDLRFSGATGYPVGFRVEYFYGSSYDTWQTGDWVCAGNEKICFHVPLFDYVSSTDDSVLALVNQILTHVANLDTNVDKVLSAVNMILSECKRLNVNATNILKVLDSILTTDKNVLAKLTSIDTNVSAIYYVLTEALKSETQQMDKATADAVTNLDNQHQQEVYWQTNAQQSYDALDMGGFSFGPVTGGISLAGKIFSDVFDTFGEYKILFTFPLLLAIALLVIGKVSRSSRGKGGDDKDA